eukprot:gene8234-8424_t
MRTASAASNLQRVEIGRCWQPFRSELSASRAQAVAQAVLQRASTSSIVTVRTLGQGAYAAVDLGAHGAAAGGTTASRQCVTVPTVLKTSSEHDWQREAFMHRECAGCPFVVHMLAAKRCRSGDFLLLLEFADKGSLTDVLAAQAALQLGTKTSFFTPLAAAGLPESLIKFYSGCILLALEWLHARRILHRDVKPCNLLLFADGYLKLADLGCCCQLPPDVAGACTRTGTAAYQAPEVHTGDVMPYSFPADMYSLGLVIFQMAAGSLPSWLDDQQHLAGCLSATRSAAVVFPTHFSQGLCELLRGLLHEDSTARPTASQAQAATWFAGFDWQGLADKTLQPPRSTAAWTAAAGDCQALWGPQQLKVSDSHWQQGHMHLSALVNKEDLEKLPKLQDAGGSPPGSMEQLVLSQNAACKRRFDLLNNRCKDISQVTKVHTQQTLLNMALEEAGGDEWRGARLGEDQVPAVQAEGHGDGSPWLA